MRISTAVQMREMDRIAIYERGVDSCLLMERAAWGVANAAKELAGKGRRAVVFSGPGNNGGDGVCAARLLLEEGFDVLTLLVGRRDKMTADTAEMERRLEAAGGTLVQFISGDLEQETVALTADVIIDAIFGIGLNSNVRGDGAAAIALMNRSPAPVVSADVPSGVEADSGRILGNAVRAAVTVTFTLPKLGHVADQGALHTGRLIVHDIGIPADLIEREQYPDCLLNENTVKDWLPVRPADGHKGDFGKVCILAGSVGYTGAPVLAAEGAAHSGAGLVFLAVPEDIYPIVAERCLEVMPFPLPTDESGLSQKAIAPLLERLNQCDAALIGPGLGQKPGTERAVLATLTETEIPLVVDADGLNVLSRHMDILDRRKTPTVLTPHEGEFLRLGGSLERGRAAGAREFAQKHGCVLVLKGYHTIIATPEGRLWINITGNDGMAKGGSGDVLGGVILALLGQGMEAEKAAAAGACVHGVAGDICAARLSHRGMLPSDLIATLPAVWLRLEKV